MIDIDSAVERGATTQPGPVCLLDMGDNVGGGSPGDGTLLLESIGRHGVTSVLACLCDAESVERAVKAGIGADLSLELGGKSDRLHGNPVSAMVRVRGLYDGQFSETEPRHGGLTHYDMGRTAVVQCDSGPTVLLTSRRTPPFSLGQLASCHLDPRAFQAIVVKGVHAPLAAYSAVCPTVIRVDTPGVTTADIDAAGLPPPPPATVSVRRDLNTAKYVGQFLSAPASICYPSLYPTTAVRCTNWLSAPPEPRRLNTLEARNFPRHSGETF